jgi:hypothetical protein
MRFFPSRPIARIKARPSPARALRAAGFFLFLGAGPAVAAATLTQQLDTSRANVGDEVTVTFNLQDGGGAAIVMPSVDGLRVVGDNTSSNFSVTNGTISSGISKVFTVIPVRAGDFTIPSFAINIPGGQVLRTEPIQLHVEAGPAAGAAGPPPDPPDSNQQGGAAAALPGPGFSTEPVPTNDANAANLPDQDVKPPVGDDGRPLKVFMRIIAQTTDAYVGEAVPLRIEFYIRMDSIAQQDSLPTIEGSNFLMNDLSVRPGEDDLTLMNEAFHRETWVTAISAPRNGDFPLKMGRDTYWAKNSQSIFSDPLGNIFGPKPTLAHGNVESNELTFHVHALPDQGRPASFTGAIGQFRITGDASPTSVNVGEPIYLTFSIAGEGNFDRVHCPALAADPAWKSYVPESRIDYLDESHTQGTKTFQQAIIPQKGGELPIPSAVFSYFDPATKQYVTVPLELPGATVVGLAASAPTAAAAATPDNPESMAVAPATPGLFPNRLELGSLHASLAPAYRQPLFWLSQAVLLLVLLGVALAGWLRSRRRLGSTSLEKNLRRQSRRNLEEAMDAAVRRGDARAFFRAARQTVQLQGASRWGLPPEAVTLPAIAARDPELAEAVAPLFAQADEVIYSAHGPGPVDLAAWERRVREEMLQPESV